MPTDRIFKFSVPGLVFLLTSLFFYDVLGGNLDTLVCLIKERDLIPLFVLIFSAPIVGVIFSTITLWLLQLRFGHRILYYPPTSLKIIKNVLKDNSNLKQRIIANKNVIWTDETLKEFYPLYQAKLRKHLNSEQFRFLERRWSAYWTHINNISTTIFSFLIIGIIRLSEVCSSCCFRFDPDIHQILGAGIILLYIIAGYMNLKTSKEDASKTEHAMFENEIKK